MDAFVNSLEPLPLNFPQTFMPERRLLAKLLQFAATNGSGDKVEIGAQTGIPTGESTGKVEPMIRYSEGMGLILVVKITGGWQLGLTPLGRIIMKEDPYLSEHQTMWTLHLMLCRRLSITSPAMGLADPWFALFAEGGFRLGKRFSQNDFLDFLIDRHGDKGYLKSLSGVVIRSYLEESCLGSISALLEDVVDREKVLQLQPAPANRQFFPVYATYLYLVWDDLFSLESQISLEAFSRQSRCFAILGWDDIMVANWLDWMSDEGLIQIDRYTGTPILLRLKKTEQVIDKIYGGLI
jgi:hypothetical protein